MDNQRGTVSDYISKLARIRKDIAWSQSNRFNEVGSFLIIIRAKLFFYLSLELNDVEEGRCREDKSFEVRLVFVFQLNVEFKWLCRHIGCRVDWSVGGGYGWGVGEVKGIGCMLRWVLGEGGKGRQCSGLRMGLSQHLILINNCHTPIWYLNF